MTNLQIDDRGCCPWLPHVCLPGPVSGVPVDQCTNVQFCGCLLIKWMDDVGHADRDIID